ncbi:MAG: hypothetical protein Q8903_05840 [Bacteroidota bacterium]|nr:hypothetical protein [Bacteroidota bacterium]
MTIALFVTLFNIIIGLLIPIRQYKNGLFLFFLVSGIADPITFSLRYLVGFDPNIGVYIYFILTLIITTYYIKKGNFTKYQIGSYILLFSLAVLYAFNIFFQSKSVGGRQIIIGSQFFVLLPVTYNILVLMTRNIFETGKINLYFVLLSLSQIITIVRIGLLTLRMFDFVTVFFISYFIEAIISIFFLFYNIKNSPKFSLAGSKAISEETEE